MAQPNFCFRKHNLHSFQKLVFRHSNLGGKFNCLLLAGSGYWEALHEADWKGIACQRRALLMNGAPSSCSFCERVGKEKAGLSGSCLIKTKTDVLIRPVAPNHAPRVRHPAHFLAGVNGRTWPNGSSLARRVVEAHSAHRVCEPVC